MDCIGKNTYIRQGFAVKLSRTRGKLREECSGDSGKPRSNKTYLLLNRELWDLTLEEGVFLSCRPGVGPHRCWQKLQGANLRRMCWRCRQNIPKQPPSVCSIATRVCLAASEMDPRFDDDQVALLAAMHALLLRRGTEAGESAHTQIRGQLANSPRKWLPSSKNTTQMSDT